MMMAAAAALPSEYVLFFFIQFIRFAHGKKKKKHETKQISP